MKQNVENITKNLKCSITLEELYKGYNECNN